MDGDDTGTDGDVEIRMSAKDAAKLIETLSSARYLTDDVRAHALRVADLARTALAEFANALAAALEREDGT